MSEFFYSMVGWGAAFCSWLSAPANPDHSYEARKRRQAEALRAMRAELYGRPRLVQGGKAK